MDTIRLVIMLLLLLLLMLLLLLLLMLHEVRKLHPWIGQVLLGSCQRRAEATHLRIEAMWVVHARHAVGHPTHQHMLAMIEGRSGLQVYMGSISTTAG